MVISSGGTPSTTLKDIRFTIKRSGMLGRNQLSLLQQTRCSFVVIINTKNAVTTTTISARSEETKSGFSTFVPIVGSLHEHGKNIRNFLLTALMGILSSRAPQPRSLAIDYLTPTKTVRAICGNYFCVFADLDSGIYTVCHESLFEFAVYIAHHDVPDCVSMPGGKDCDFTVYFAALDDLEALASDSSKVRDFFSRDLCVHAVQLIAAVSAVIPTRDFVTTSVGGDNIRVNPIR